MGSRGSFSLEGRRKGINIVWFKVILNSCKLLQNIFHKKKKKSNGASSRLCWNPPDDAPVLISSRLAKDQTVENLTRWHCEHLNTDGRKTVGRIAWSSEKDYPEGQGKDGGNSQDFNPPLTESWSSPPSQATQTAEVTSSSPQAVAYTSFSSLTFALLSSEHWGGERTCPEVKDVQLKSHQSFQAALWAPGSQQPSHHAHPHQNEQSKLLPVRTKEPLFLQTDKNLLLYQKTERKHTAEI